MATLEEATKPRDTSQMTPVEPPAPSTPPPNPNIPGASPFLRSPLPVSGSPPDSQRQYYVGPVPLTRIIPPPPLTAPAGGGGTVGPTGARGPQGAQGIPGPLNVTHSNPFTAHNIIIGNGGDDIEPLGSLGTTTTVLHGNASGNPSFSAIVIADLPSNIIISNVGIVIDGGSTTPSTGSKGYIQVPYSGTITSWTLLANASGSAQITVKKSTYSGFPTTSSIVAAAPPALSSAQKNTSSSLGTWTTAITAGDILEFNLDSVTTCTRLTLQLVIQRS